MAMTMTTALARSVTAIFSLTALVACTAAVDDPAVRSGGGDTAAVRQAVFDCNDPGQRFTCAPAPLPHFRFVCHATGSRRHRYVKLLVPEAWSAHAPGVAHGHRGRTDHAPGASGADVGAGPGLDCDCDERVCAGACTGAAPGAECDDGDPCTGDGTCAGGVCQRGAPRCTAGELVDACNAQSGACSAGACVTTPQPAGTPCADGNVCNGAGACIPRVVVNEVESSGGSPGDWVELFNAGTSPADVSGWRVLDNDDTHTPYVIPAGAVIPAGGTLVIDEASLGFGLGGADSARLFDASGVLVDAHAWTRHADTTYGRCPDGTGAFATTTRVTRGAANDCSAPVVINEVESSGGSPGDWVELYNAGVVTVDVSGWVFKDNDDTHAYAIPAGTTLAPGGYLVLDEAAFGFGLGSADAARLFDAAGGVVDAHAWTAHAPVTYGRCPNGAGAFATTTSATRGGANDCGGGMSTAQPWPGRNAVVTVDDAGVFGGNLSDLYFEPTSATSPDVLWAVRNGPSTLFRLVWNGSIWTPDATGGWSAGKTLRYPGGAGSPDAEGVTRAESGSTAIYVATERDNDVGAVSRPSVLRFDTSGPGAELIATHEWNLASDLPAVGANLGLEAITWVPDSYLVANAFFDEAAGALYDPARYPGHGSGLFLVGLEANGQIYAYALDHVGGGFRRVATIASGDGTTKALAFDRDTGYLWTQCGAACGGQAGVLAIDTRAASPTFGRFGLVRQFARPTTMANLANEGFAIAPEARCVGGAREVLWSDDGETAGHSLRADTIPCGRFIAP